MRARKRRRPDYGPPYQVKHADTHPAAFAGCLIVAGIWIGCAWVMVWIKGLIDTMSQ